MELAVPETLREDPGAGITAMVGMAGDLCGMLTLRGDEAFVTEAASRMLGLSQEEAALQGSDALGEICNMIAGNFKAKIGFEEKCMLSVPTVITGDHYSTHSIVVSNHLSVQLLFEGQYICITLETRNY
jgi:chemotaxis protein CheX